MKKQSLITILFFCALVFVFLLVTGCTRVEPSGSALTPAPNQAPWADDVALYVDPETGCQYFQASGAITPRLNKDGSPWCNQTTR